jgi:hypothetical protein
MNPEDLNPWFYPVNINGKDVLPGVYPNPEKFKDRPPWELVVRQNLRRMILVGELTKKVDLTGMRILDVACNCAFWSSIYIKGYGAKSVIGIEGREVYIKQAEMLYESMGIRDKATFWHDDAADTDLYRGLSVDFILCAGLLYHLNEQEPLLRMLCAIQPKYMLLDTRVWPTERKAHVENRALSFNGIPEHPNVTIPTLNQIQMFVNKLGYDTEPLPVPFDTVPSIGRGDDYNADLRSKPGRVALMCYRRK